MASLESPLVSVVFTSYNHKEYLRQALESLISQTYDNIEIIVVDDCSTDGSQEILQEYNVFSKVKLHLKRENSGSYVKASNYGAKYALGEFILFAQCDDYAEPNQIEQLVLSINDKPNFGVAFSASNLVDKNSEFIACDFNRREYKFRKKCAVGAELFGSEMRRFLSFACVIPNLSAALVRRSDFIKVGGLPEEYPRSADWAFWLNLSEITNFVYIRDPLNNFRQHNTTIRSKTSFDIYFLEIYNVLYKHAKKNNLCKKETKNIKIGAGAIWFWYFLENPKGWITKLPYLAKITFSIDRFNVLYLGLGTLKHIKERFNKIK